jgi:hypothetical protein
VIWAVVCVEQVLPALIAICVKSACPLVFPWDRETHPPAGAGPPILHSVSVGRPVLFERGSNACVNFTASLRTQTHI